MRFVIPCVWTATVVAGCTPATDDPTDDALSCGANTTEVDGVCVGEPDDADLVCGDGTVLVGDACIPEDAGPDPLLPGQFSPPLVELQRLQGTSNHMHISEVEYREADQRLFFCSYYFGVIRASNPQSMSYLAQMLTHDTPSGSPRRPGCNHLALDDDDLNLVFTTHRKNYDFATFLSSWVLQPDPVNPSLLAPVQGPALQEPGVSYEGIDVEGDYIYAAIHEDGLAVYSWDVDRNFTRVGELTELDNTWEVRVRGDTAFIADGYAGLVIADVSDPTSPVVISRLAVNGQVRDLDVDGDVAWLAAGAAGVVAVDVSDLAHPEVLSTTDTPGTASGVDYDSGRVYVATWTDTRVFDVADPTAPAFVAAVRNTLQQTYGDDNGVRPPITARTFDVVASGDTVFVGNWWVPYSYKLHADNPAPYIFLPETINNIGFGPVAVGASATQTLVVRNDGNAPLTVYDAWAANPAFTVNPRQLLIEPGMSAELTLTYTATTTEKESALLTLRSDDPSQPVRQGWLVGNQPGLGVGVPLPETTGDMIDGSTWSSTEASGNVLVLAYFATFCPVCATELPDLEVNLWERYRDQGLQIVALDKEDDEDIFSVGEYAEHLGVTFDVGIETTSNYELFQQNFDGANPFPTDVVVDRQGIIRYVAVEYDPEGLRAVVEQLLAE